MYRLAYVECLRPMRGHCGSSPEAPQFRIEPFASPAAALDRAREIIGAPTISSVELHTEAGEIVLDVQALALALGWPLPPQRPVRWQAAACPRARSMRGEDYFSVIR